jgi:hypothetical protein
MLQQRTPKGLEFRITNEEGLTRYGTVTDPNQLKGQYDIEISPESSASNKQVQLETATQILQMTQNPVLIQTGIVTPQNIYEGAKNYMKVLGIKDISRFLNNQFENQIVLLPREELDRVLGLENVAVLPNADHEGFIGLAQEIMQDDMKLGLLNKDQVLKLNLQMQRHQQMMQAIQAAQAQQANVAQQNQNAMNAQAAQNSAPAAPVGGVMGNEGGI